MILHNLVPDDFDLYCAQLDVLTVRIETLKAQKRSDGRICTGARFRRLRRIERQCRLLRRLLFRCERSGTRLHSQMRATLQQARGSFRELTGQAGDGPPTKNARDGTIRIETIEAPNVVLTALPPSAREQRIKTGK